MSCSTFTFDGDPEEHRPCRCPTCKAFLPGRFPLDKQFLCRKCGAVLTVYPSLYEYMRWHEFLFDSSLHEIRFGGRICVVPELAITISTVLPPRIPKTHKKKTELWAMGEGFSRRVWTDKEGQFIEVGSERMGLEDERIHLIR